MRVDVLPFGVLKDGISASSLELAPQSTVADLVALIAQRLRQRPDLTGLLPRIAISVNAEYAQLDRLLHEGDEIGLLPPVSGGSNPVNASGEQVVTYLTRDLIVADELVAQAKKGSDGAVVVFDGVVRDNTRGRSTLYLDYEAYETMAEKQIAELAVQAISRFGVRAVTLVHRLGRLLIGETSVLIIVASAHRGAAYDASRWLIDTLKKTVPIWKKETFVDGAVWADGEPFPAELLAQNPSEPATEGDGSAASEAAL